MVSASSLQRGKKKHKANMNIRHHNNSQPILLTTWGESNRYHHAEPRESSIKGEIIHHHKAESRRSVEKTGKKESNAKKSCDHVQGKKSDPCPRTRRHTLLEEIKDKVLKRTIREKKVEEITRELGGKKGGNERREIATQRQTKSKSIRGQLLKKGAASILKRRTRNATLIR